MKDNFVAGLLIVLGVIVVSAVGVILQGWALSILWKWFVVPPFAFPALSIVQAIGFSLVVRFITIGYQNPKSGKEISDILGEYITSNIIYPLIVLGFGWIIFQFV